jgi:hypothetical protein
MIPTGDSSPGNTIAKQICLDGPRSRVEVFAMNRSKPAIDEGGSEMNRATSCAVSSESAGASDARSSGAPTGAGRRAPAAQQARRASGTADADGVFIQS